MVTRSIIKPIIKGIIKPIVKSGGGGGGGGGGITAADIDGVGLSGETVSAEFFYTGVATNIAYQWKRDAAPISGESNPNYTLVDADVNATISCEITVTFASGNQSVTAELSGVVGKVWLEDWNVFSVGDVAATLLANGYAHSASGAYTAVITADADAPQGKKLVITSTSNGTRTLRRTDITTFLTSLARQYTEALFLVRPKNLPTAGVALYSQVGLRDGNLRHLFAADDISLITARPIVIAPTPDELYWIRLRHDKTKSYLTVWEFDAAEPFTYQSEITDANDFVSIIGLTVRTSGAILDVLFYSAGVNARAPYWPGYTPALPGSDDPLSFETATEQTEIEVGEEIVWELDYA
jgi:hypothetical protein